MSKKIFTILTFLLLFILSGCGSNSKPDGNPEKQSETVAVEMQHKYIVQDESGIDFTLAIPITKKLDSSYLVKLSKYDLTVEGCSMSTTPSYAPATLTLDGGLNSVETLYVTGTFDQNCTVNGYTFTATQTVTKGSNVDTRAFSAAFDYSNPEGSGGETSPATDGYSFYNATTPLEIRQTNTNYDVKAQVLLDMHPVSGQIVRLAAFPSIYGDVKSYSVTTGEDGYAVFAYTSPEILPANGPIQEPLIIVFKDESNATYFQEIVLNFNNSGLPSAPPVDTANYVLQAVPSAINISTDETSRVLDLYLSDTGVNAPVADQEIRAQFVNPDNGTLGQYTATTDATGHVAFNYTGPETFTVGDSFDIIFDVPGGTVAKSATVAVTFVAADFDYTLVNVTTPLLITYGNMEKEISVHLVDSDNVGIAGETLSIATIADGYGSVSASTATTDASGKATFDYTAPDDITNLVGTNTVTTLSFTKNGTTLSEDVTIMVSGEAMMSDYRLMNPAPTKDITDANQTAVLDIQLIHTVDGKEIPVIDARPCVTATNRVTVDCVIPEVIPREYGRITSAAGSNSNDGYIYFDYVGPESGAPGFHEFEVYYIDENGKIADTNRLSVDVNIP